jgi:virulence factor
VSDPKRVKVGVVGLGAFAHVARLPVLAGMDNVEMTACMARTPETVERAAQRFGFARGYTELAPLIVESGIEAAFVTTPKTTHHDIVIPLLEKGIHVFCEKPMAMTIPQAEEMVACAEANGRVLMIGFNRRYAPVYDWAKREFADRPPDVCVAFKNRPGSEYRATMENAIHMVDLLRFFCGECTEITAHAKFSDPDYEDSAAAMLKFETGSVGFLLGNRTCGQWMERVELYGGGRTVVVHCPEEITVVDREQEHTRRMTPLRSGWATLEEKMGFRQEVQAFFEAVVRGTPPRNLASDSIRTHVLVNRLLKEAGLPEMGS